MVAKILLASEGDNLLILVCFLRLNKAWRTFLISTDQVLC